MSQAHILLDPDGTSSQSVGALVIETERAFLEEVVRGAIPGQHIVVRGRTLCQWVREWTHGREIPVESLESPRRAWRRLWPKWTDQEIDALQRQSGMQVPCESPEDTLASIFPAGPWHETSGVEHAARWLLWLAEAEISEASPSVPLLQSVGRQWAMTEEEPVCHDAYSHSDSAAALAALTAWLFDGATTCVFPVEVPDSWLRKAKAHWQFAPIHLRAAGFWNPLVSNRIHRQLRRVAASLIDEYLQQHPDEITLDLLTSLRPYLNPERWQVLQRFTPPSAPPPLDRVASPASVLRWVRENYLPFRQWQAVHGSPEHRLAVEIAAEQFADWLLEFYPVAVNGGRGNDTLLITASSALQDIRAGVTIWAILDGLPLPDAEYLGSLLEQDERLTALPQQTYFTCLPTITRFCKPALMNGRPPDYANITETPTPSFPNAVLMQDKTMRQQAADAENGQVLVLSLKDPDAIYHRNQSRETTMRNVTGRLGTIAETIRELVDAVPMRHELTLIVTTDHGRLLEDGVERRHSIPDGAASEGRTIWGTFEPGRISQSDSGVLRLTPEAFRLPPTITVEVARDHAAFVQKNGASGTVSFPHGGLWPEEVVVSWHAFARDARRPDVRIQVGGIGRTGGAGRLRFTIDNSGATRLTVESVSLASSTGNWQWSEDWGLAVDPQHRETPERSIERWPRTTDFESIIGTATISLPSGVTFEAPVEVGLDSESLYQQNLSASDLLDL